MDPSSAASRSKITAPELVESLDSQIRGEFVNKCLIENADACNGVSNLNLYRNKASFFKKELQEFVDDVECVRFREVIYNTLEKDPLFHLRDEEITGEMSLDEYRMLTHQRAKRLVEYEFLTEELVINNPLLGPTFNNAVGMLNWCCVTRYLLHWTVSAAFSHFSFNPSLYGGGHFAPTAPGSFCYSSKTVAETLSLLLLAYYTSFSTLFGHQGPKLLPW